MTTDETPRGHGPMELDFSQFHPTGDHWPWQCGDYYGGWRTHVAYAWQFRWRDRLRSWTFCKLGRHHAVTMTRFRPPGRDNAWYTQQVCGHCVARLGPKVYASGRGPGG